MQYIDSNKRVVLLNARNKDHDQLAKDHPFSYARLLFLDYEDPDSKSLILLVDCSKGVRKMYVSEDQLVKESRGLKSFKFAIETTDNLITTVRPYIQGHVNLREASPSPQKPAPKKVSGQSRQARKNVTKMSESEDSRTTDEEDSPGAELASRIPSSDQNKIRREMMQNLPITHIHRPLVDAKTGRRPLEIREPHKLHV